MLAILFLFCFFLPSSAAALEFVKNNPEGPINQKEFEEACGVGVVITPEQIEEAVSACTTLAICLTLLVARVCLVMRTCCPGGESYQEVQGTAVEGEVPLQHGTANGYYFTLSKYFF